MSRYVWYKDGKAFKETRDLDGEELIKQYFDDGSHYISGIDGSFRYANGFFFDGDAIKKFGDFIGKDFNGNLNLYGLQATSLGKLESVSGFLTLQNSPIESLGELESVGGGLDLYGTPYLTSMGNLKRVGGEIKYERNTNTEKLLKERGLI